MTLQEFRQIAANGIWKQNTSLVQILGLCPLLAVTTNLVNGAMLSLATILVMALSGFPVSGSIRATFETLTHASCSMMPPSRFICGTGLR